jgi:hypothetical protein
VRRRENAIALGSIGVRLSCAARWDTMRDMLDTAAASSKKALYLMVNNWREHMPADTVVAGPKVNNE